MGMEQCVCCQESMKNVAGCVCQAESNRKSRKVISKTNLLIQKKETTKRTYTDSSSKLSFTDLVNNFESKITSSKLPNSRANASSTSAKTRLILSTPTKRGRGLQSEEENTSKIVTDAKYSKSLTSSCSKLNQGGVGGGESPAKRRRCDNTGGSSVLICSFGGRNSSWKE